jgi:probable rRNA maturation factor
LELQNPEISILLLDDRQISELNQKYLRRNGPTDVISFPQQDGSFPQAQPQVLGDVVISVETARQQALKRQAPFYEEILVLLIHGVLHLLGFDHEKSAQERKKMQAREKELFASLMQDKKISAAINSSPQVRL